MDALLIILGLIWLGYSALFAGIIFLGWLIGRISRNQLLVKLFYVLMALIATFDIPYGVFTYSAKMHSWPEYVINKTIYTIARHDEYSVFTSMENDFDINQFLKLATECYKSEKNSCTEAALKEIKVEQSQLNSKGFKQYTYVYYRKRYGTCQLDSQEIYDLKAGELLGRSREMALRNIILAPFFNSLLGGPSFGSFAEIVHNRGLSYDVFPRLREDVVK